MGVRDVVRHSTWICWKDLLEFSRSRIRLVMLVLMPLLMMSMVGFIFPSGNSSISDQPVAISMQDQAQTVHYGNVSVAVSFGLQIDQGLHAINNKTGMMKLSESTGFEDIRDRIDKGDLSCGIIIPANFTSNILARQQGYITLVTDQSNPQLSQTMSAVISGLVNSMGTEMAKSTLNQTYHVNANNTIAVIQPLSVHTTSTTGTTSTNYFEFVAPGIIAMTVMMSLMTGLPHAISYEKDMGTLDGMLVAPINRLSIVLGKVMAQTIRGLIQAAIIFALAIVLFGVIIYGNILLVIAVIILTVFSFVGLGILITSFMDKEETATMVMMTLMFPMMFLSGVFFPIQMMPWYMQDLAHLLPLTYASTAMRKVIVLGAGVSSIMTEIIVLFSFGIVLLAIAVPTFKKAMSR